MSSGLAATEPSDTIDQPLVGLDREGVVAEEREQVVVAGHVKRLVAASTAGSDQVWSGIVSSQVHRTDLAIEGVDEVVVVRRVERAVRADGHVALELMGPR